MATTKLIPGFRFHPTDVELLKYFLKRKVMGRKFLFDVIAEVDIYKYSPWDLPDKACLRTGDLEWYFFCPREKKYASGARMNRATEVGYWKTTGKDRPVHHKNQIVGLIKTLIFHTGKAPKGERTDWVMHEFRLESNDLTDKGIPQDSYVLCKVFHKDGPGPRNGAQYGKPFNEEDWDDDGEIECVDSIPLVACSALPTPPITHLSSVAADTHPPLGESIGSLDSCVSGLVVPSPKSCSGLVVPSPSPEPCFSGMTMPCPSLMLNDGSQVHDIDSMLRYFTEDDKLATNEKVPAEDDIDRMLRFFTEDGQLATNEKVPADDDIESMLRFFTEDDDKLATNENPIEKTDDCGEEKVEEADIFKDLEDINKCTGWGRWT